MGSLACCLCDLEIMVDNAQMNQFRMHMQKDHDILEEQEPAMALTFLTRREKRELWWRVEDRRNTFLNTGSLDGQGGLFNTKEMAEVKEEDICSKEEDYCGNEKDNIGKYEEKQRGNLFLYDRTEVLKPTSKGWILNDENVKNRKCEEEWHIS